MRQSSSYGWVTVDNSGDASGNTIVTLELPTDGSVTDGTYSVILESYDANSTIDPPTALKTDTLTVYVTTF